MAYELITDDLSDDEIEARIRALNEPPEIEEIREAIADQHYDLTHNAADFRHFRPLVDAADEYISWAQSPEKRVYTGLPELDDAMRGVAPGELALVVGYAHSGKTVFVTEVILNNRRRRIALFTPDETRVLVLVKLTSVVHNVSAYELERRIADDDPEAIALVRSTARDYFPNLAVFDEQIDVHTMDRALDEAESHWGAPAEMVVFDYADLLDGIDDTRTAISAIKGWGKRRRVPLFLLHQSSRTKGADGAKVKIDSGGFGGEQQATFVIGVRRKRSELLARIEELEEKIASSENPKQYHFDKLADAQFELRRHENTITFNLVKNKRPPSPLVDDLDFHLDYQTGRIRPMERYNPIDRLRRRPETTGQQEF